MAHYISEKIAAAGTATGTKKKALEQECFDIVLKLWSHRWELPSNRRPFKEFDQLFETIKKLDPDNKESFYVPFLPDNFRDQDLKPKSKKDEWLSRALQIDKSARICMEFALQKAAEKSKGAEAEAYLKYSSKLAPEHDREIIRFLLGSNTVNFFDEYEDDDLELAATATNKEVDKEKKFEDEKIKSRIKYLEEFSKDAKKVIKSLKQQLIENQS
ncbi:hypothetical protein [Pedobacter paludis]|nr:hypothetical protein [Pedobacter paludis]